MIPIAIDRARYWALTTPAVAFYGSLASNLADVIDDSIDTAATNGSTIKWSPKFVEGLTDAEVRFVLLHETLHCAHDHFHRLPLNDQGNEAGDYAINAILAKVAGISMPKGGLLDAKFDNFAVEEILAALAKRLPDTRSMLTVSWSLQRAHHGEQPFWAALALAYVVRPNFNTDVDFAPSEVAAARALQREIGARGADARSFDRAVSALVFGDRAASAALFVYNLEQDGGLANNVFSICSPFYDAIRAEPAWKAFLARHALKECPYSSPWPLGAAPR